MQRGLRGRAITFIADPFLQDPLTCVRHWEDALILVEDGRIAYVDDYAAGVRAGRSVELEIDEYPGAIICPGFIDTHVHFPQLEIIGGFGAHLLEWLERYAFPAEQKFGDIDYATRIADLFVRELLRNGTTTASVYCTVHPESVEALFSEAHRRNMRMIAGKVMMDRNAPAALLDTVESSYRQSLQLIERWHGVGRQLYCITPRFAPTSSDAQLAAAGHLWAEHPGTHMQTHICENVTEIERMRELFPDRSSYLDVYRHAGLVGERAIFGHAIHMQEEDFAACHNDGSAIAHCPTSNFFLGSGLFRMFDARDPSRPVTIGLGTDVGGGTSLSQLRTMAAAYETGRLCNTTISPLQALYLATRGGAEALSLDAYIGSIAPGYEADLVVLDPAATPVMKLRADRSESISDLLFGLIMLGDDRAVRATYVAGEPLYRSGIAG
jgi:guanine deaminase